MARLDYKEGLEFDDVLILPRSSKIKSRREVDISVKLTSDFSLAVPIIASPMRGIVGTELIIELGKLGGLGILHRFFHSEKERIQAVEILEKSKVPFGVAVGLDDFDFLGKILRLSPTNTPLKVICLDVANGYLETVVKETEKIYDLVYELGLDILIIAGNVVTDDGIRDLYVNGADMVRVGIGSGALCTTRNKTGVGAPQISMLLNLDRHDAHIISDGGIRNSGDIVKALASGADSVMIGSLLAQTKESDNNGTIYGMASEKLQAEFYGKPKSIEGIEKEVEKTTTLRELIEDISWCIKSACTYVDARNLAELKRKAVLIKTGTNSIVRKE